MMMTSGGTVHYKSMMDAGSQIIAKEGTKSLFKGAGANILRGIAGAGVLSLYDKMQELMFGKVYSVRMLRSHAPSAVDISGWFRLSAQHLNVQLHRPRSIASSRMPYHTFPPYFFHVRSASVPLKPHHYPRPALVIHCGQSMTNANVPLEHCEPL